YAEIFSLVPDKDPPIGNLLYVHILNMPVDAAVAFLAQNDDILREMVELIPSFVHAFPTEQVCRICWEILSNSKLSIHKCVYGYDALRKYITRAGFVFCKHIFQVLVERADISDDGVAEFIVANKDCQEPADSAFVNDILCSFPKERAANIRKRVASSNQ
ncbi:MAG: hypothetical protein LBD72_03495, partial [Puniceicoccales bacterium]|nr:hypothetical protein [Puniceicoccales bacterium]